MSNYILNKEDFVIVTFNPQADNEQKRTKNYFCRASENDALPDT